MTPEDAIAFAASQGVRYDTLITTSNPKITKSNECLPAYWTGVMHLTPGASDICPDATEGCRNACLGWTSGRSGIQPYRTNRVQKARAARTKLFRYHPHVFYHVLCAAIQLHTANAAIRGRKPMIRLNGTSDIPWESWSPGVEPPIIGGRFPVTIFYDYTKTYERFIHQSYILYYSVSEDPRSHTNAFNFIRDRHQWHLPSARLVFVFDGPVPPTIFFDDGVTDRWKASPRHRTYRAPYSSILDPHHYFITPGDDHDLHHLRSNYTCVGLSLKRKTCTRPIKHNGFAIPTLKGATLRCPT